MKFYNFKALFYLDETSQKICNKFKLTTIIESYLYLKIYYLINGIFMISMFFL